MAPLFSHGSPVAPLQRSRSIVMLRRISFWLAAPALLALVPVAWAACDAPMENVDLNAVRPCSTDCDCYTGRNYELGTRCDPTVGLCLCPLPNHRPTPCCEKGKPIEQCNRQCRPAEECADEPGTPSSEDAGSSTSGAPLGGACKTAKDCPQVPDPVCGVATCTDGVCGLKIKLGPIESQRRGDCRRRDCDVSGKLVTGDDPSDVYNDGQQCTVDVCEGGMPKNIPLQDGFRCPETKAGYCYAGACVECVSTEPVADCGPGYACDGMIYCVSLACQSPNGMKDGPETGVDCGGPCVPCFNPQTCLVNSDCFHGVCQGGMCALPTDSDGVKNDSETGIDCGGPASIPRCPTGEGCKLGADCASGVCWTGKCQAPTCKDGTLNGNESGVDCGGSCAACQ